MFPMKPHTKPLAFILALAVSGLLFGCDRTVSKTEKTDVNSDGSSKTKETTVTEKSDGSVVKKEQTTKTEPAKP